MKKIVAAMFVAFAGASAQATESGEIATGNDLLEACQSIPVLAGDTSGISSAEALDLGTRYGACLGFMQAHRRWSESDGGSLGGVCPPPNVKLSEESGVFLRGLESVYRSGGHEWLDMDPVKVAISAWGHVAMKAPFDDELSAWVCPKVPTGGGSDKPCSFGPVSMRVQQRVVLDIVYESLHNPRLAWHRILALEEDPELEPFTFTVASEDDGLGHGLTCPKKAPVVVVPKPGDAVDDSGIVGDPVPRVD